MRTGTECDQDRTLHALNVLPGFYASSDNRASPGQCVVGPRDEMTWKSFSPPQKSFSIHKIPGLVSERRKNKSCCRAPAVSHVLRYVVVSQDALYAEMVY